MHARNAIEERSNVCYQKPAEHVDPRHVYKMVRGSEVKFRRCQRLHKRSLA